jgi:hypothetical protein
MAMLAALVQQSRPSVLGMKSNASHFFWHCSCGSTPGTATTQQQWRLIAALAY